MPEHQQNPFIISGYRMHHNTYVECIRSLFTFHNESLNVWTHLLGAIWFLHKLITFVPFVHLDSLEDLVVLFSLLGCLACLGTSAWFHLCLCLPCPNHYECLLKMDFFGIMLVTFTLYLAGVCLVFGGGRWALQAIYVLYAFLSAVLASLPLTVTHLGKFTRASLACFGFSAILPVSHWFAIATPEEVNAFFPPLVTLSLCFCIGMILYATAWPERQFEGYCDYFFHSHQLWHVLVFCGLESAVQGISALHSLRRSPYAV